MADFTDLMRRKQRLTDEIERREQAYGRLESDGRQADADLARFVSELQFMEHHRQILASSVDSLELELGQIQSQYGESASALTQLTDEFETLLEIERSSLQECIDQTVGCPGCGCPADGLTWTWVEFFNTARVSGWRAVCPACRADVEFFEVE